MRAFISNLTSSCVCSEANLVSALALYRTAPNWNIFQDKVMLEYKETHYLFLCQNSVMWVVPSPKDNTLQLVISRLVHTVPHIINHNDALNFKCLLFHSQLVNFIQFHYDFVLHSSCLFS